MTAQPPMSADARRWASDSIARGNPIMEGRFTALADALDAMQAEKEGLQEAVRLAGEVQAQMRRENEDMQARCDALFGKLERIWEVQLGDLPEKHWRLQDAIEEAQSVLAAERAHREGGS